MKKMIQCCKHGVVLREFSTEHFILQWNHAHILILDKETKMARMILSQHYYDYIEIVDVSEDQEAQEAQEKVGGTDD